MKVLVPAVRVNDSLLLAPSADVCPLYAVYELERGGFKLVGVVAGRGSGSSALREVVESERPDIVIVPETAEVEELEILGVRVCRSRELEVEKALRELGGTPPEGYLALTSPQ